MINDLIELDKDLFIYLNGLHSPWLDAAMFLMSETYCWIPLYGLILYLCYVNFGKDSWLIVVGVSLTVFFSDQITSTLMKPFFMRLRPSHEPQLQGIVHLVKGYRSGSLYGFASSHAANTFGIATFVWLLFKQRYKSVSFLFAWALIVSYTRIYLGVHYPGDILAGAIIGVFFGYCFYRLFKFMKLKIDFKRSTKNAIT